MCWEWNILQRHLVVRKDRKHVLTDNWELLQPICCKLNIYYSMKQLITGPKIAKIISVALINQPRILNNICL